MTKYVNEAANLSWILYLISKCRCIGIANFPLSITYIYYQCTWNCLVCSLFLPTCSPSLLSRGSRWRSSTSWSRWPRPINSIPILARYFWAQSDLNRLLCPSVCLANQLNTKSVRSVPNKWLKMNCWGTCLMIMRRKSRKISIKSTKYEIGIAFLSQMSVGKKL